MSHFWSGSEYDRANGVPVQESAESMNWIEFEGGDTILREREREKKLWMAKDEILYINFRARCKNKSIVILCDLITMHRKRPTLVLI
jgi:hypothetical protein